MGALRHAGARQLDMFGLDESRPRIVPAPPEFAPYPDALLRRLGATLRLLQSARHMPWPPTQARAEAALFLAAVERLPPDRRGGLAADFRAELARLS